jgi:hypothetical protein
MAITLNGVKNSLPDADLPSGYTRPTVTTFSDWEYKRRINLTVLKSTVENATASTTMTNIIDNATIGLDKQIDDILAADFLGTATVTAYADWVSISNNYCPTTGSGDYLTDTACSYQCTLDLYVKAA